MDYSGKSSEEINLINIIKKRKISPLEPYFSKIIIDPKKTILLGQALAQLIKEEADNVKNGKFSNKGFNSFKDRVVEQIRHNARKANIEDILNFALFFVQHLSEEQTMFSVSNLLFGCKSHELEESKTIFELLTLCWHENRTFFRDVDDQLHRKSGLLCLITDFIINMHTTKTFENLIILMSNGDSQAEKIFQRFILIYLNANGMPRPIPYSLWQDEIKKLSSMSEIFNKKTEGIKFYTCVGLLPVPDIFLNYISDKLDEIVTKELEGLHLLNFVNWFWENIDDFDILYQIMWEEILNQSKYWIRSNGKDVVKLDFDKLNSYTHELLKLQFIREQLQFPRVWARFWCKLHGNLHIEEYLLGEAPLLKDYCQNSNLANDDPRVICDKIYLFIATHCLWKIATAQKAKTTIKSSLSKSRSEAGVRATAEVRPHFRRLPEGYLASEEAKSHSKDLFGFEPPKNMTFVKQHLRNLQSEYEELDKIIPLFNYSNEDLTFDNLIQ